MNVKELKELAWKWHDEKTCGGGWQRAQDMHDAIIALPDDPPADHQDLVKMARVFLSNFPDSTPGTPLALSVINRFGKKEPRKVDGWIVMRGDNVWHCSTDFNEVKDLFEHTKKTTAGHDFWIARVIATEEI